MMPTDYTQPLPDPTHPRQAGARLDPFATALASDRLVEYVDDLAIHHDPSRLDIIDRLIEGARR